MEISVTASGNGNNSPWYIPHAAFKRGKCLDNDFVNLQHLDNNMRDTSRPVSNIDPNSMLRCIMDWDRFSTHAQLWRDFIMLFIQYSYSLLYNIM